MDNQKSGKNVEKKGVRRVWTRAEEEALLSIFENIVAEGGRCEGGNFKAGTLKQVENMLRSQLPDSGLKAFPHIDSKHRKWKVQYGIVHDMLNTSGFGWNDTLKCVEVDSNEVWQSYVQAHEEAKGWRDKSFPLYDRLVKIYGNDRATGQAAATPAEMVDEINEEEIHAMDIETEEPGSPLSAQQPSGSLTRSHSGSSSRKRKRSQSILATGFKEISTTIQNVFAESFKNMEKLIERIFRDTEDRSDIADELAAMGLSQDDGLEALTLILEKPSNISAFKSLKGTWKQAFVEKLLRERARD